MDNNNNADLISLNDYAANDIAIVSHTRFVQQSDIELLANVFMRNKYEDITIIWFDDNIDEVIEQKLQQMHDNIILCFNFEQLSEYVNDIQNQKIVLIVSGRYFRDTLSLYNPNEKIESIYIFCLNFQSYGGLIGDKKYSKLIGVYTQYDQLFKTLDKEIYSLSKYLSIFDLFDRNNKSVRDLEYETADYSFYQILRDTLMKMQTKADESKQDMLNYCRYYYQSNMSYLKQTDQFEKEYQPCEAIRWFTKDWFLFRFVNKALRTENIDALFKLRYFIIDLCTQLKLLFDENYDLYQETFETITVYRGLNLPDSDIEQLKNLIGKYVSTNRFLSTSLSRDLAQIFAANVLFVIKLIQSYKILFMLRYPS
ncbi:unnamed protein product [Didymodactylos carnosus]|uniref:Uncharacterized protein n=1 Tax=Didymodactylos carnosus TaxID=1234261 RepID=A0A815NIW6_9BILA|nr:unnamed protein product [Didymodactylos carnosus]CAF1438876.1 unnamed protein product [Didymodactylos carnosus]CAF4111958.1 unnamed protein product [Didymodactylos carnosus]CAF4315658.1 unnamed protein product [Didymodactylos carnosus]